MNTPDLLPTASEHVGSPSLEPQSRKHRHSQADPARSNRGTSNDWRSSTFASRANIK